MRNIFEQICSRHGLNIDNFDDGQEYDAGIVQFTDEHNKLVVDLLVYKQQYSVTKFDGTKLFSGTWTSVIN